MQSSILATYKRSRLSFNKGKGSYLITRNGKKYLDFVSGIAVNSLGHCNSELIKVLHNQSKKNMACIKRFSNFGARGFS